MKEGVIKMKWIEKIPQPFFMVGIHTAKFLFWILSFVRYALTTPVRFDVVLAICSFFAFFCGLMNWCFERLPYSVHLISIGIIGFALLALHPIIHLFKITYTLTKK